VSKDVFHNMEDKYLSKHKRRLMAHQEKEEEPVKHEKKKHSKKIIIYSIIIIILASIVYASVSYYSKPGQYDDFAKCLSEKGIKMYGADWCPNCKAQKKMFGKSFKYVNYVECTKEKEACANAQVEGYPTWIYNAEKYVGVQSLSRLSSITECTLSN